MSARSYFLSRLPGALGPIWRLTGIQMRGADALYARLADVYLSAAAIASLDGRPGESELERMTPSRRARNSIHARAAQGLPAPSLSVLRPAIDQHFSRPTVPAILASLDAEARARIRRLGAANREAHAQPFAHHAVRRAASIAARQIA